jgi:hypothetical protein
MHHRVTALHFKGAQTADNSSAIDVKGTSAIDVTGIYGDPGSCGIVSLVSVGLLNGATS